jgi:uncharacterized protein (TIGR00304 family)
MATQTLYGLGTALVFAGIMVMAVATVLIILSRGRKTGKVRAGGAIIIGPVPIVFGTDKETLKTVLLLSIILTALLIALIITLSIIGA